MSDIRIDVSYIEKTRQAVTVNQRHSFEDGERLFTKRLGDPAEVYEETKESTQRYLAFEIKKAEKEYYIEKSLKDLAKKTLLVKNFSEDSQKFLKIITINSKKYYVYVSKGGHLYITQKVGDVLKVKRALISFALFKCIYLFGIITNTVNKANNFETVYMGTVRYNEIIRPFKRWKFRHIAIIKIKLEDVVTLDSIHNALTLSNNEGVFIPLVSRFKFGKGMRYYCKRKYNDKMVLLRSIMTGKKYTLTQISYEKEYALAYSIKNTIARIIYPLFTHKKINLMFEKETGKANESGWYVFCKIMEYARQNKLKSNTYFIIDENSNDYEKVIRQHKENIIKKYSLKHYIYIYASRYFISSELSNHVINPRLYIKSLNNVISQKPLIFLQHGIMFAKPVDNPAASGFYKKNKATKIYKSVVCSDLEAEQFYRMGYNRKDLLKTGLPKFDISYMDADADKIMVMLTYRYWEEAMVNNEETIQETTYYQKYMRIIKAFEENGLLDRLIMSGHPKFILALEREMGEYKDIIETDINRALERSRVFITDYSSASYDAHYRGAYIIYDWEEKDYLLENYKAVPPINEENCDGVPTYSVDELIDEVKKAIEKNYVMDKIYQDRYMKINEFSDGKNGDRLIAELCKQGIL